MTEQTPLPSMAELRAELLSEVCRCGSPKLRKETFCKGCYFRLPRSLRNRLYRVFGQGYEEAHADALKVLDAPEEKP